MFGEHGDEKDQERVPGFPKFEKLLHLLFGESFHLIWKSLCFDLGRLCMDIDDKFFGIGGDRPGSDAVQELFRFLPGFWGEHGKNKSSQVFHGSVQLYGKLLGVLIYQRQYTVKNEIEAVDFFSIC